MPSSDAPRHLRSLTGLRYLAAGTVVFHHSVEVFGQDTVIGKVFAHGYVGVPFFFVLSGFVLTWTRNPATPIRTFYRRRFARIYPMYAATFVGAAMISYLVGSPGKSAIGLILGMLLLQAWFPVQAIYQAGNPPGWSLSAEAFFYAAFPFLAPRILARSWLRLWPSVAIVSAFGIGFGLSPAYSHWFAYYSPVYGLLYFIVGILAAKSLQTRVSPRIPVGIAVSLAVGAFIVSGLALDDQNRGVHGAVMLPFLTLVVVAGAQQDLAGKRTIWASRPLVLLGTWSFALYLIHFSIVRLVSRVIDGPLELGSFVTFGCCGAMLLLTTAISAFAYQWFERPLERLIRGGAVREPPQRAS